MTLCEAWPWVWDHCGFTVHGREGQVRSGWVDSLASILEAGSIHVSDCMHVCVGVCVGVSM